MTTKIDKMVSAMVACGVDLQIIEAAKTCAELSAKPKKALVVKKDPGEMEKNFDHFWGIFPKRFGANPKHSAKVKFISAVNSGEKPADIIAAALKLKAEWDQRRSSDRNFIPMASTWLHQRRWRDEQGPTPTGGNNGGPRGGSGGGGAFFDLAAETQNRIKENTDEQRPDDTGRHAGGSHAVGSRHQDDRSAPHSRDLFRGY